MQSAVIFASGRGSNAKAILQTAQSLSNIRIVGILSDNPYAGVQSIALEFNLPFIVIDPKSRESILAELKKLRPDWAFLAGFMRIIPPEVLHFFKKPIELDGVKAFFRVLNIHPSVLPTYPGLGSLKKTFLDLEAPLGATVHFVDEGLDTGPIFRQQTLSRIDGETLPEFELRLHKLEHELYSESVRAVDGIKE